MKKFLFVILMIISTCVVNAQVLNFRTTSFSKKVGSSWGSWQESSLNITMDLNNDIVTIYSPKIQMYKIYSNVSNYYDSDGDYNMNFKFIDQDGDQGTMTLLQRTNGRSEIYIRFRNIQWCYVVRRL